jgi:uncharacterized membrane protein
MKRIKHLPFLVIMAFCLAGIGYGYWGAFTLSGQHYYDEMAAMYPFFVLVGCCCVLLITLIVWLIKSLKKR